MSELQVSPERSLRGGPRAARRAVAQLIRLGRSAQVYKQNLFIAIYVIVQILSLLLQNQWGLISSNVYQWGIVSSNFYQWGMISSNVYQWGG